VRDAAGLARTGDLFLFRGTSAADKVIRTVTNAPVNHVGMAIVLDDLPPLMWHAELSQGLLCVWCGHHHRGVQLHDLEAACVQWMGKYAQRGWMRQLSPAVGRDREDAALTVVARMDGLAFPSTVGLVRRWIAGRARTKASAAQVYCAEVVAETYATMGLFEEARPMNWYDPGRFWSGDELDLADGFLLGDEVELV